MGQDQVMDGFTIGTCNLEETIFNLYKEGEMGHKTRMSQSQKSTAIIREQSKNKRQKLQALEGKNKSPAIAGDSGQYQFMLNDVTSEFDPLLMGREGSRIFSEMSKSDGIVGGILLAYMNLILSCNWTLDEIKDITPEEQKVKDILYEWTFEQNNFEPTLDAILKMLPIGFSCFNKYYTQFNYENQFYMMPVLLERLQKSIWRIDYEKEIIEQVTSKGSLAEIPFKDLVFFTFRKEGNDLRGVSLLRQAYYDFKDKTIVKQIAKKGITRELLGLPIGRVPANVRNDDPAYTAFADLLEMLSSRDYLETDDSIILPQGYELEMFKTDFKIDSIKDFLTYYDSSMAISVLAQFILLGQQGKGGSYSLGSDQSDFFLDGLQYIIDYIEGQYTKHILQPTVRGNWENVDESKFKLRGLNLNKKASEEFAKTLQTLIASGVIKVQTNDEKKIREMYDLPEIDEKERAEKEEDEKPPEDEPTPESDADEEEDMPEDEEEQTENSLMDMKPIDIVTFWKTGKQRDAYIDQEVAALTKYSKASLQIISEKLLSAIRWQLKKNSPQSKGLKDIKLNQSAVASYKKNMGQKLSAITLKSWNNAKEKSKPHLEKLAVNPGDLPSKTLTSFIINQSDLVVEGQTEAMRTKGLHIANTASTKGYGLDQTLAQVEAGMDDFIASGNNAELANMTSITQATSYGEMAYYKSIDDNIWGYKFENVSPKTNICQNLVGEGYHKNSAAMEQISPPLHFRCKSYFEPIYKDNEKPEFDDYIPAPSIMKERTM